MPFLVALEARPSSLGGNGLFAVNDIPAETKLWVMKPKEGDTVVPLKLSIENPPVLAENRVMAEEDMLKLSAERVLAVFWGGYAHEPSETWIELRDGGNFTNHSDDKWNCGSGFTDSPWDEEHFAKKDIKAGDEILDDYGGFAAAKVPWIVKMMEKTCPGRFEFERDNATPKGAQ